MTLPTYAALWLCLLVLAGCDLFATRTPELPVDEAGTFLQPDTPDQVVANVQAALAELSAPNYRRSFADDLVFRPTATAEARDPSIWSSWSRTEEERYLSTLAEDARLTSGNELRLNDSRLTFPSEDRALFEANYVLTINHRRPGVPQTVQGHLIWALRQGEDGLWRIHAWTDQELGDAPSWSDLKAAFVK